MLLYQPQDGYCYNSDSVFLADFITKLNPKGDMLDVGSGCGVVGLLVAQKSQKINLFGVEKQKEFIFLSNHNATINNITYKLYEGDFLEVDFDKKFDYIVSNPPFYHNGVEKSSNEMLYNARYNVNLPIGRFFKKVSQILKPKGHFVFCYDAGQFGLVSHELYKVKLNIVDARFVHPKEEKEANLVMIHARSSSKSMAKVHRPLIHFKGDDFSDEVKEIYKDANTWSIKCRI